MRACSERWIISPDGDGMPPVRGGTDLPSYQRNLYENNGNHCDVERLASIVTAQAFENRGRSDPNRIQSANEASKLPVGTVLASINHK